MASTCIQGKMKVELKMFHNAREIREVLAIFSRDLMKDKLGAV